MKLRGYNGKVDVFRSCLPSDGARVLKRVNPDWSSAEHLDLAAKHRAESERLATLHGQLLDQAHVQTFGRPREITDYRISAIGREEYPADMKQELRKAAHGSSCHSRLAWAHLAACRRRSFPC
ncbi:hypothetical protein [Variovorax sp. WDL1]|uniref:hypothetical protein n=1 Tax=Variovorax sp. WDL1 TaxID=207745 RepID=UPI0018DD3B66|nr:hypothetical protein [Variovorax sp. WDL1]